MSANCYEMARELGQMILSSEQSIQLADATAVYKESPEAQAKMEEYKRYQQNVQDSMKMGAMSKEEFQIATKRMTEMAVELKQDPIVGALVFAENEFNGFVNQVLNVLKMTIQGQDADCAGGCESCGGGCAGHHHS